MNQIINVLVLLGTYLVLGSAGVPLVTILSLYVLHGYTAPTLPVHRANNDVSHMKDGIYLVEKQIFGWNLNSSIGVCHNGVFHATYHGSGDIPLHVNGRSTTSVFASPQADITTGFGDPQFSKPKEDYELYVLVNRVGGQTTYKTPTSITERDLVWPKVTEPGESGSPIVADRDGQLVLVALAGNYVQVNNVGTDFAEIMENKSVQINLIPNAVTKIALHPGSGKTFRITPKIIRDTIPKLKKKL